MDRGWNAASSMSGRSGLIALLHRLGMEHRKPKAISRKCWTAGEAGGLHQELWKPLLNQLPAR